MKDLKDSAREIFLESLKSLSVESLIEKKIQAHGSKLILNEKEIDLSPYRSVVLLGIGKASISMAEAMESLIGDRLTFGFLVSDHRSKIKVKSKVVVGGHPTPDSQSVLAGKRLIETIQSLDSDSLIIFLISGGGSALAEVPIFDEITLNELQDLNRLLVNCGAAIQEINCIRKHLSRIKGGRLGYLARKFSSIAIYLSDVNPGDVRSIASNPILEDGSSIGEVLRVIEKYDLRERLPQSIAQIIDQGRLTELPRGWFDSDGEKETLLLADNFTVIDIAGEAARNAGFVVEADKNNQEGNYRDVAENLIDQLKRLQSEFPDKNVCVVSGGEVSCPVSGDGLGGRNQEFVLYSAARLEEQNLDSSIGVLSCGTDGIDGNSNAAGAMATGEMIRRAKKIGLEASDFIRRNDSHTFFSIMGGLIQTGPAGNNLRDLRLFLSQPA